ncbi:AN1-type zinc finger protein 1 [Podospora australis]|uniref:AN1-type zinc finger protein 1 n=1 Tax=Podospora australis TaxID=1536484 RepID=A0AAN6WZ94_9PEZI|nr:AN1-type zinc finger protein 1 [Podospora australis]
MSSPSPKPEETSYLQMSKTALDARGTDATLIGSHCQYTYCNQLDFLPFKCQSCSHTFCLEHRTEDGHECTQKGAWAERRRQAELAKTSIGQGKSMLDVAPVKKPCADDNCDKQIGTALAPGVRCNDCRRDYCMKHRLKEDHDCKNKVLKQRSQAAVQASSAVEGAKSALERFKLWGASKREAAKKAIPATKPSSKAAQIIAVNNLKKKAKGDAKIAPEKRVYLYVEAESETAKAKIPKGEFFYSKDWVVGKMLDAAAQSLQVQNLNNRTEDESNRLRVFHVEGGRLLDFGEKIGTALQSGNTVVLLRGAGPPPDLITM